MRSLGNGMIPVFEEQDVRIENRMSLAEWDEVPYMERVMIIAVSRIRKAISNLQSEAEIRDADRKRK